MAKDNMDPLGWLRKQLAEAEPDLLREMAKSLDEEVQAFRGRPLDGGPYPYLWLDALAVKVREEGRIVRCACVLATAVDAEGYREILGCDLLAAEDAAEAHARLAEVVVALEQTAPKVARLLEGAEDDLLAYMSFPREHWCKLRSTNPLERVNREIGRRSDVVGIYPNDAALIRLAGSLLIEQNDEWLVGRRYLSEESLREVLTRAADAERTVEVTALPAA